LIELLRLSYWYNKCSSLIATNNTFLPKRKEVRGKLTRGLLSNIEKYKTTVPEEEFIDDIKEFREKLEAGITNAKKGKPQDDNLKVYERNTQGCLGSDFRINICWTGYQSWLQSIF
jgi:hypothetical protein